MVMDQNTQKQTVKSRVCMKEKGQRSGVCKHQHEALGILFYTEECSGWEEAVKGQAMVLI